MKLHGLVILALISLSLLLVACGGDDLPEEPLPPRQPEAPRVTSAPTVVLAPAQFRLTILHNGDGESQLLDLGPGLEDFGGVALFAAVVQREKQIVASDQGAGGNSGVIMVSSICLVMRRRSWSTPFHRHPPQCQWYGSGCP